MRNTLLILVLSSPLFLFGQVIDSTDIKQIDSITQIARELTGKKEFDKAIEINSEAEKLAVEKFGKESAAYGSACFNHGRILDSKGVYAEAAKWYLESKSIREKVLGKEHPDYISSLYTLGLVYLDMRDFIKSEQHLLEVKAIYEKTLGNMHLDYASVLGNLALLYDEMGDYTKAILFYIESKAIKEKLLSKEHPDYATNTNNLGLVYLKSGDLEKAQPLLLEGKMIREKILGKAHPLYASSLNNLAQLYAIMGNYEKAVPFCIEAKDIREKSLGKTHPRYGWSVNNLASLYGEMGDYEAAEALFIEAADIKKSALGTNHPDYANSLSNIATINRLLGNFEKSEALGLEALSIAEKVLGKEHPDYLEKMSQLGILYFRIKNYQKAEALYIEAKNMQEKTLGKDHADFLSSLSNLATLYLETGAYPKAEPLFLQAKSTMEKVLGKTHPNYASNLFNLGTLYYDTRKYDNAKSLYLEALSIQEKALGKTHPNYVATLTNLTNLYWSLGDFDAANNYLLEANVLEKNLLIKATRYLSERELSSYTQTFEDGLNRNFSFAQSQSGLSSACYDNILFHKGFLLNSVSKMRKLALTDSNTTEKYNELKSYQRRLATEYAKPIAERKNVSELEEKANTLEKEIARNVAGFGEALRQVSWQEVQQKLKPNEAAVEFVHYQFLNPKPTDSTMYAALVLRPGAAQPIFIPLFEEKQLDKLLQGKEKTKADYVNNLYTFSSAKSSLYELLWQPLAQELTGVSTVYFSPSGLLHRINIAAIPLQSPVRGQGTEETLADRYQLIELGSTRQLTIDNNEDINKQSTDALLYGGIQYEADSTAIAAAISDLGANSLANRGGFGFNNADTTLRGGAWNYLKWTEVEVNAIETILSDAGLRPTILAGFNGSEESFKLIGTSTPAPRVLHLATHGFFFPDPKKLTSERDESVFKISDHPMIRSGIILSGGNHAWQTGKPFRPNLEDGILTAYEISQMNLSGTELVVLSACETGLGDIQGNEGVYGLQRAFKIAGVKYLIMSLWQVPDYQTQELMTTFYSNWLDEKMPIPEALRAAQKAMKTKYKSPFFWAGFVLVE